MKKINYKVNNKEELHYILIMNTVSNMIHHQQRISDDMYQEAIEANYSHEQMTPLNSILGNSNLVKDQVSSCITNMIKETAKLQNPGELPKLIKNLSDNICLVAAI